mmetsp:Transcript_142457/g.355042  ORF Transcript_142457/g.355042 Transcript_142457/m.355042 type:complete len:214 (-) Transcript_142457:914-1555(-)
MLVRHELVDECLLSQQEGNAAAILCRHAHQECQRPESVRANHLNGKAFNVDHLAGPSDGSVKEAPDGEKGDEPCSDTDHNIHRRKSPVHSGIYDVVVVAALSCRHHVCRAGDLELQLLGLGIAEFCCSKSGRTRQHGGGNQMLRRHSKADVSSEDASRYGGKTASHHAMHLGRSQVLEEGPDEERSLRLADEDVGRGNERFCGRGAENALQDH